MSNTLLEAMASGLATVCTAVGGNTELVTDEQRGSLVKAGDNLALAEAIRKYIVSSEMRATHGHNARGFIVEHFSLARMIHRYVSLYESAA
jgi:glycosyltransferase involved in cell wall biosynthesis